MIVKPDINKFGNLYVSTTAHPEGCAETVRKQIDFVKNKQINHNPKNVLIIGASSGYGLSTRVISSFTCGANTIGVFFEKPSLKGHTATAGWYNTAAYENEAAKMGLYAKSINGDAFSNEIKDKVINLIKNDWGGKVDLVVYSLAAPKRLSPITGKLYSSVIKPVGESLFLSEVDLINHKLVRIEIQPATQEEVDNSIKVMGGEDWQLWIERLLAENCLTSETKTVAYSYLGGTDTYGIYKNGSLGLAKRNLEATANILNDLLQKHNMGNAFAVLNKGVITMASSAIPGALEGIPLYYIIMKKYGIHEEPLDQIWRLFANRLYLLKDSVFVDKERLIRLDEWELQTLVSDYVSQHRFKGDVKDLSNNPDYLVVRNQFLNLYGFGYDNVDYEKDVDIDVRIPSIQDGT